MKKNYLLSILIISLLGLVYFFWFDFNNNYISIGSDNIIPLNPQANLKFMTSWVDSNNGTVTLSAYHWVILLYYFLGKFVNSLTVTQFIHVYLIHTVGALGIYYLSKTLLKDHKNNEPISLMAGIIYLFSPAFLNMHFAFPSIAFVPLALALFAHGNSNKFKLPFALLIGFVVSLGNLPDPHPRPFFLIIVPIIIYTIFEAIFSKNKKGLFLYFLQVLLYIFLINAWYFLGFISNSLLNSNILYVAKSIPFVFGDKYPDEGSALISRMLRLFHNGLTITGSQSGLYLGKWIITITNYLTPILAFASMLFINPKRKNLAKNIIFLLILALTFLFLSKSVNPPFGSVYSFALNNIPLFRVFRTTAYFILGTAIAYSILIPFSIIEIRNYLIIFFTKYFRQGINGKIMTESGNQIFIYTANFIASVIFTLIIVNSYPVILGYPAYYQPDPAFPAQLGLKFPQEYYQLNKFLNTDTNDVKVISFPLDAGYEILTTEPRYYGIPILPYILDKPVINQRFREFGGDFSLPLIIEKEFTTGNPDTQLLLSLSNIRYVIVKNNSADIAKFLTPENKLHGIKFLKKFGKNSVYENPSYLEHIYIPRQIIVSGFSPEKFPELIRKNKIKEKPVIYFSKQNSPELNNLLRSFSFDKSRIPELSFRKISQTKFEIKINKAYSAFPLVFSESFHNGWKIISGDNFTEHHLVANSYANSWIITPKQPDFNLVIEYLPQKAVYYGFIISLITIIISFGFIVYVKYRKN